MKKKIYSYLEKDFPGVEASTAFLAGMILGGIMALILAQIIVSIDVIQNAMCARQEFLVSQLFLMSIVLANFWGGAFVTFATGTDPKPTQAYFNKAFNSVLAGLVPFIVLQLSLFLNPEDIVLVAAEFSIGEAFYGLGFWEAGDEG